LCCVVTVVTVYCVVTNINGLSLQLTSFLDIRNCLQCVFTFYKPVPCCSNFDALMANKTSGVGFRQQVYSLYSVCVML
jgi:hypothetical protein